MPFEEFKSAQLNVVELFAGVGGFRLGLEAVHASPFVITLSNQYEPARKAQHASNVYRSHWPDGVHLNEDIATVLTSEEGQRAIRAAAPDVVVGGFPCQDYSVAKPLSHSKGLDGKRGVLWWSIATLLRQRIDDGQPVKYLVLENVDRLLSSPASCRGRDFSVVLSTLYGLGYAVEWRTVNAAEYGLPQSRRRIFIVAYHQSTGVHGRMMRELATDGGWHRPAVLTKAFPATLVAPPDAVNPCMTVRNEPFAQQLSYTPLSNGKSRFSNAGFMAEGQVWSCRVASEIPGDYTEFTGAATAQTLGNVISKTSLVPTSFYVRGESEERWRLAKGAKNIPRDRNGFSYTYSEGAMPYPDRLDRPARTIITSEGGASATRTKHVVREASGLLRRLVPEELEQLNGFPRGFTDREGVSDIARAMLMGNALVVGLVTRIGNALVQTIARDQHPFA
ncbi:cytosine methyltransferase [Paraburkholderia phytofirmans OLGA172]|uniref:Cytosine-specific methyltransferase n=1 Tax=Paraburkholderia phytofirmans OLGA172 TaxID=1417228 RepID=A0A160FU99_9BURK|nr:DNA (cytosine-5-)-methyltransferase [Paraburkholderia phytofirmans]ANB76318.1 cytosine methyltransferase [Paraburkholderia phytofirmans OLGA172]